MPHLPRKPSMGSLALVPKPKSPNLGTQNLEPGTRAASPQTLSLCAVAAYHENCSLIIRLTPPKAQLTSSPLIIRTNTTINTDRPNLSSRNHHMSIPADHPHASCVGKDHCISGHRHHWIYSVSIAASRRTGILILTSMMCRIVVSLVLTLFQQHHQ